jgi:hypothetical protein
MGKLFTPAKCDGSSSLDVRCPDRPFLSIREAVPGRSESV